VRADVKAGNRRFFTRLTVAPALVPGGNRERQNIYIYVCMYVCVYVYIWERTISLRR